MTDVVSPRELSIRGDVHAARPLAALALMKAMPLSIKLASAFLVFLLAVGLLAPLLAPYGYDAQDLALRLRPPVLFGGTPSHFLGTDELGRDIVSRLLFSIRTSLLSALLGTAVAAVIGTAVGSLAGFMRGPLDDLLTMLVDIQASIPFFIVAIAIFAFFGNSFVIFTLIMSLNGWEVYARVSRGLVISEAAKEYAVAARLLGAGRWMIYRRHILRNILGILLVKVTLNFPGSILLESGLSFLGLGVQPPLTSLGLMVGAGQEYLLFAWWVAVIPGTVIFCTTLSVSLVGDWLRDRLDPKLR